MQIPGYKILRRINQGGMSTVYLAIQLSVGREVALKVMSPALNADPVFSERFQREANIVGQLSHPNIIAIYDIGRYRNLNYIAMDYLPNGSVHEKIDEGIEIDAALRIMIEMATALECAHNKGYIHRDMKPENILFRADGTAVLTDFGVAKTLSGASKMTNSGTVVGTPYYMSPEQARGVAIDGRSDLYSLGVVFYEILVGEPPYKADEAVAIAIKHLTAPLPQLPPQYSLFQPILNRLMNKEADQRFQRGSELITAIEQIKHTLSGASPRESHLRETTSIQSNSLFKALLLSLYAAFINNIKRYTRRLLPKPKSTKENTQVNDKISTEIFNLSDTVGNERRTILSTSIQQAVEYQISGKKITSSLRRIITAVILFSLIWGALGMAIARLEPSQQNTLPRELVDASSATDEAIRFVLSEEDMAAAIALIMPKATDLLDKGRASSKQQYQNISHKLSEKFGSQTSKVNVTTPSISEPNNTEKVSIGFALRVTAKPELARIRLLNSSATYASHRKLAPGRYQLEISKPGYKTKTQWVEIMDRDIDLNISLYKSVVPGEVFQTPLKNGLLGPKMVIVPAGSFMFGNDAMTDNLSSKIISIDNPFAAGQYEVTYGQYSQFSRATNRAIPKTENWGETDIPMVNIAWQDAVDYTQWLSRESGKTYRLLSESEWEYVARAGVKKDYWWGEKSSSGRANCRRGCASSFSNMFKTNLAPVGSFKANAFKLYDTAGNAAEWTYDCFRPTLKDHHRNGKPVTGSCELKAIRGGSMMSAIGELASHYRSSKSANEGYDYVGFRVAMDID